MDEEVAEEVVKSSFFGVRSCLGATGQRALIVVIGVARTSASSTILFAALGLTA